MLAALFEKYASEIPYVSQREIDLYDKHHALLSEWNRKMSLVSRKSFSESFAYHYIDSIYISDKACDWHGGLAVYDLGSGAGFPGIIFAIRHQDIPITLFERGMKKRGFLQEVVCSLGLKNVLIEETPATRISGAFMARAVLPVDELFMYLAKILRVGSRVLVNLGSGKSAMRCAPKNYRCIESFDYVLPSSAGVRRIECFEVMKAN